MTILSVAYPLFPVGPDAGGGAEQMLFLLDQELVKAGERSIVIAASGSKIHGELIETPVFTGEITDGVRENAQRAHLLSIDRVLHRWAVDLVHFHGLDFHAYLPSKEVPKLATLHLPPAWYPPSIFELPDVQLNCVSRAQSGSVPGRKLPVVCNGIATEQFSVDSAARHHILWLGRICPEKGVDIALRVAHRLDLPMIVAGPVHAFRSHRNYFSDGVQPLLDDKRNYVGAVGLERKKRLLAEARCLLIPSLAPETSSLVAMEAISSGTPVVAFGSGALPEIVEDGVTGFIVDSEDTMVDAVKCRLDSISPDTCRARARLRFDAGRMAGEYVSLYREVIGRL